MEAAFGVLRIASTVAIRFTSVPSTIDRNGFGIVFFCGQGRGAEINSEFDLGRPTGSSS